MATETSAADCHPAGRRRTETGDGAHRRHLGVRELDHRLRLAVRLAVRRPGRRRRGDLSPGSSAASPSSSWRSCTPSWARCTRWPAAPRGSRTSRSAASPASSSASSPGCRPSPSRRSSASRSCTTRTTGGPAIYNPTTGTSPTGLGLFITVVLLAIFTRSTSSASAGFQGQQRAHVVEGHHPGAHHRRPAVQVALGNWTAGGPGPIVNGAHINGSGGSRRSAPRACSTPWSARASSSPTSASSRPTSWPARSRTRSGTCRARSSARC